MSNLLPLYSLTPAERLVLDQTERGEPAVLQRQDGARPPVRAALLRHLLLGLPLSGAAEPAALRLPGVRLHGARIEGPLDLSDCALPGEGLPALVLEDCDIPEPLDLSACRLARLSIAGSRFRFLNMREADIDGPFDFSSASPLPSETPGPAEAWIDLRGSIVNGQLTGNGARLRAPPPRELVRPRDRRAALWMENVTVHGSVMLMGGFAAVGGVSMDAAVIRGDVWANGALVTWGEGDPFRAQSARIGGLLVAEGLTVHGMLWLLGVHIGGVLQLSGARLYGRTPDNRAEPQTTRKALIADHAEIGGAVFLIRGFTAYGRVSFSEARIGGDLDCTGAEINNRTADGRAIAIEAVSTEIADNLILERGVINGTACFVGTSVGGSLLGNGARLDNLTPDRSGIALRAANASTGEDMRFGRADANDGGGAPFRCYGRLELTGAKIAGDLSFPGAELENASDNGDGVALLGKRMRVAGTLEFTDEFRSSGAILMTATTLGGELRVHTSTLHNHARSAIYGKDMRIGDDLVLMFSRVAGDIRFERAQITGSLEWTSVEIDVGRAADGPVAIDLRHARIGSALKAYRLMLRGRARIDFGGTRVATIEHDWPDGWGGDPGCPINLDGFVYDRIAGPPVELVRGEVTVLRRPGLIERWVWPKEDDLGRRLCQWLGRQEKPPATVGSAFFPQPYRQLARVLRAQGDEDAARVVTVAGLRAEPKPFLPAAAMRAMFDHLFGFGIRRRNAVATLAAYIAIGGVGVWLAHRNDMLVETSVVVAEASAHTGKIDASERSKYVRRAFVELEGSGRRFVSDIACSDAARNLVDDLVYAADMLVPFIPLHQESKCEIRPDRGFGPTAWRVSKAVYSVVGWIVFSLALLTFSGVLKRYERDGE